MHIYIMQNQDALLHPFTGLINSHHPTLETLDTQKTHNLHSVLTQQIDVGATHGFRAAVIR